MAAARRMAMTRSENMARIKRAGTRPEELLRRALWRLGLRYRIDARTPAGRADIVFPSRRFAIFVDGCFWHGCPEHYVKPRSSAPFWSKKLLENVRRDQRQIERLTASDWRFERIWEHEIAEDVQGVTERAVASLEHAAETRRQDWRVVAVDVDPATQVETRYLECLLTNNRRAEEGRRVTAKVGRITRKTVATPEDRQRRPLSE